MSSAIAVRDLSGTTALVTGASSGVGRFIAEGLAARGARVLLPVGNRQRGEGAIELIRERIPAADLELYDLDLSHLGEVRALAAELAESGPIHTLVLNAGIATIGAGRQVTEDGLELHFQVNFLANALLVRELLPQLSAGTARVVVQGSLANAVSRVPWRNLQLSRRYNALRAYGASKLELALFGTALAQHSAREGWGLSVVPCHPGVVPGSSIAAPLRAVIPDAVIDMVVAHLGNTPERAAQPALAAAVALPAPSTAETRAVPTRADSGTDVTRAAQRLNGAGPSLNARPRTPNTSTPASDPSPTHKPTDKASSPAQFALKASSPAQFALKTSSPVQFALSGHLGIGGSPIARKPFPRTQDPVAAERIWTLAKSLLR